MNQRGYRHYDASQKGKARYIFGNDFTGNKEIENKLLNDIKTYGLEKNIIYKWFISWDEKFEILSTSKIFLFPSYYESFGQVALEAMKLGTSSCCVWYSPILCI